MNNLKQRPLAVFGFTALGIMLISIILGHIFVSGVACIGFGLSMLVLTVISKRLREVTVLFYLSASLLFSGILLVSNNHCSFENAKSVSGEQVSVVATVTSECEFTASRSIYILKTDSVNGKNINVKLRFRSNTALGAYPGDTVKFVGDVYCVDRFSNSLKNYYLSEGIYLDTTVYDAQNNVELLNQNPDSIENKLFNLRNLIKSRIYKYLPNEYGGVSVAMLLGDMSGVSEQTSNSFRLTGISHLFAVSGLHLSVWVMGIFRFLHIFGVEKKINSLISIFFVLFVMLLTGMSPSIVRAGIMLIAVMSGNFINRRTEPINALGLSLMIILAFNPMSATSVSLLLSVMSTLGIVTVFSQIDKYISPLFERIKYPLIRKPIFALVSVLLVSVVASIFTLPVNVFSFSQISLIGPATNVLVSNPSTLLMILSGVVAVFGEISWLASPIALVCGLCGKYIIKISDLLSQIPNAVVKTDSLIFEIGLIFLLFSAVCCFIIFNDKIKRLKSITAIFLCTVIVSSSMSVVYNRNLTKVNVLDVDDGICVVIENSGNKIVLGAGGSDDYALSNIENSIFSKNASMLLIPDDNEWNSLYAQNILSLFNFEKVISGEKIENVNAEILTDFKITPWQNACISFHHGENFTYAHCVFDSVDMLIVFDSDIDELPKEYLESDILICSYYLPQNTDVSGFSNIVISSTNKISNALAKEFYNGKTKIYSTSGERNVTLELKDSVKVIYD